MKAKHARALTKRAISRAEKKQTQEQATEDEQRRKDNERYMRDEYPAFEAEVYADIRKATKERRDSIRVVDPRGVAWERLEKKLRADGYSIQEHFEAGEYENMGDFNAPCNIWRDPYRWYEVSW